MSTHPILQRALDDARAGRLDPALSSVRRHLRRHPEDVVALQVLGRLSLHAGQTEQAAHHLSRAVGLQPRSPQLRNSYANVLLTMRRYAEAVQQSRAAVEIDPHYAHGWLGLACALSCVQDYDGAIGAARRGLDIQPESPDLHVNLILSLEHSGQLERAVEAARSAIRLLPGDGSLHSLLLFLLNYTDEPADIIAAEHKRFGALHATSGPTAGARTTRDPERPLRIGLLSSDLKTHSVGYFAAAILAHAPPWVELIAYSLAPAPGDAMAVEFKSRVREWTEVGHADDAAIDSRIRAERIDILLELNGHTGGGRPAALVRKPAPVIISAIGYPNTTGIPAVDWRLVDSITDPQGSEHHAAERLLRLDPCFLCFRPPAEVPPPISPAQGPLTFGSFNQLSKFGPVTCAIWSRVLGAVPGSRLLVKSKGLADAGALARVRERLERAGIEAHRLEVLPATPTINEHLGAYGRVHIALDTSPYNGTTTTCEALWMGVPVVTLAGDRHASRVGASLLTAAGLSSLIARTPHEYVTIAAGLAGDQSRLAALRGNLRDMISDSPLCDQAAYAARFYNGLRACWRDWCSSQSS